MKLRDCDGTVNTVYYECLPVAVVHGSGLERQRENRDLIRHILTDNGIA